MELLIVDIDTYNGIKNNNINFNQVINRYPYLSFKYTNIFTIDNKHYATTLSGENIEINIKARILG